MKQYDVEVPSAAVNRGLYLDETDGWMECEHCHETVRAQEFIKLNKIPVFNMGRIAVNQVTAFPRKRAEQGGCPWIRSGAWKSSPRPKGISLAQLARMSGVSNSTLKNARSRNYQLSVDTIERLCAGLRYHDERIL